MHLLGISTTVLAATAFMSAAGAQEATPDISPLPPEVQDFLPETPPLPEEPSYTFPYVPIKPFFPRPPACIDSPITPVISFQQGMFLSQKNKTPCEAEVNNTTFETKHQFG